MATMTADEYREIVKAIINTATGGSVGGSYPWNALNNGNYSAQDFYNLMQTRAVKNAGYDAVLNADGSVRTYTYINKNGQIADLGSYDDIAGAFNSNYQTGTASAGTVQFTQATDTAMTTATETAPSVVEAAGTMSKFTNGVKGVGSFVFGSVLPAIGAAATGIALGKIIDKGIYEVGTNVFGADNLEAFNPDTWGTITAGDDSLGAKAFNTIFGINPDTGNTQMYLDENAFAYLALYMEKQGFFEETTKMKEIPNDFPNKVKNITEWNIGLPPGRVIKSDGSTYQLNNNSTGPYYSERIIVSPHDGKYVTSIGASSVEFKIPSRPSYKPNSYKHNGKTVYYDKASASAQYGTIPDSVKGITYADFVTYAADIAWLIIYNTQSVSFPGTETQNNAKLPDLSNISSINDALQKLKETYPNLWDNRVENSVVQPDGTIKTYTYVPVPMPTGGTADQPTTEGADQSKPEVDPSTATDTLLNTLIQILTQTNPVGMTDTPTDPINPNAPDTGSGDTPVVVIPTGSANALYSIYNPSQSQLNSFGAWLWSSDFVDQLLKLFNDPMQAIIGLHKVFATPPISGSGTIKVGYLDSGVSSNIVGNQYTTVDCGSVSLSEYFGNVFDYEPYTKVNLYLPFIGIVPLSVGEVMRSTIHVVYHVDVLTGACLAEVKVKRDAAGGTLFQYSGNAAVQYPISSGSYMGIISGIMSIAGGVAGTIATGGAAMPVLLGAGASVGRMHTNVSHSGSFSGNSGAMGIKKPYLIIDRPQTALADNFQKYVGFPANYTTKLSACSGFVKVLECHIENVNATSSELTEIETLLKEGVLV